LRKVSLFDAVLTVPSQQASADGIVRGAQSAPSLDVMTRRLGRAVLPIDRPINVIFRNVGIGMSGQFHAKALTRRKKRRPLWDAYKE
jgi:hypothetical protein